VVQIDVVAAAEEDEVGDLRLAAVDPRHQVMGVAHDRWRAADHAASVAGVEGAADGASDESLGAADVQWFRV